MRITTTREIKIEIAGTPVETSDCAIIKFLYRHAGGSGEIVDPKTGWAIPLSVIPRPRSKHKDHNVLLDTLDRLMSVKVNVVQS